jgi:two-component system, OmpR family, sensor kinase
MPLRQSRLENAITFNRLHTVSGRDQQPRRRTHSETALTSRLAELEAEIRARDEFLAVAAHELRNPMTPIAAWVELLSNLSRREAGRIPPEILRGLERLEYLVDAYIRRATTLLDVARISSQDLQLSFTHVDLSSQVRNSVAAITPAAHNARSCISLEIQENLVGDLDQTAVEQIIENLLSNAVRYGAGGPIEVTLVRSVNAARLSIRDHGIGISECDQVRIFEKFQRAATSRSDGGFGVGLWITRQLVLAMRGEISVTSALGLGSTFTVVLPLKQE